MADRMEEGPMYITTDVLSLLGGDIQFPEV
jgi:hypothetical protein